MEIIGMLLACLVVGAIAIALGSLLFYGIIIVLSKIANALDIGCGCFGLIFVGFLILSALGLLPYIF